MQALPLGVCLLVKMNDTIVRDQKLWKNRRHASSIELRVSPSRWKRHIANQSQALSISFPIPTDTKRTNFNFGKLLCILIEWHQLAWKCQAVSVNIVCNWIALPKIWFWLWLLRQRKRTMRKFYQVIFAWEFQLRHYAYIWVGHCLNRGVCNLYVSDGPNLCHHNASTIFFSRKVLV